MKGKRGLKWGATTTASKKQCRGNKMGKEDAKRRQVGNGLRTELPNVLTRATKRLDDERGEGWGGGMVKRNRTEKRGESADFCCRSWVGKEVAGKRVQA